MNTCHCRFLDMEDPGLLSDSTVFSASAGSGMLPAASFSPTLFFLSFRYAFSVLNRSFFYPDTSVEL